MQAVNSINYEGCFCAVSSCSLLIAPINKNPVFTISGGSGMWEAMQSGQNGPNPKIAWMSFVPGSLES